MGINTSFTKKTAMQWPIIQAPMIGYSSPELVASVSNSGGLGSLAAGNLSVEKLSQQCLKINELTQHTYAVNFFVRNTSIKQREPSNEVYKALLPYYKELALSEDILYKCKSTQAPDLEEQIDVAIKSGVSIVSFAFGLPEQRLVEKLKGHDITIIATATTIVEAELVQRAGFDAVVLQGTEAGGHRATFQQTKDYIGLGLLSFIAQAQDILKIPIIAAGGIMNGAMITSCLQSGAQAVQIGTAFLFTKEAAVDDLYLQAISAKNIETILSKGFTGKYARVLRNKFTDEMEQRETAPFPFQGVLIAALLNKANELACTDLLPFWAGQSVSLGRKGSAEWLMKTLIKEIEVEN